MRSSVGRCDRLNAPCRANVGYRYAMSPDLSSGVAGPTGRRTAVPFQVRATSGLTSRESPLPRVEEVPFVLGKPIHSKPEAQRHENARKAANAVAQCLDMAATTADYNPALFAWQRLSQLSLEEKELLPRYLRDGDIETLWLVAGKRKYASPSQIEEVMEDATVRDILLPGAESCRARCFRCRTTPGLLPWPLQRAIRYTQRTFFTHPATDRAYVRVRVGGGAVGELLCSPYMMLRAQEFDVPVSKASLVKSIELGVSCDTEGSVASLRECGLCKCDLPHQRWPEPTSPPWPFNRGYTELYRVLAPGVIVGRAYCLNAEPGEVPVLAGHLLLVERKSTCVEDACCEAGWEQQLALDPWM